MKKRLFSLSFLSPVLILFVGCTSTTDSGSDIAISPAEKNVSPAVGGDSGERVVYNAVHVAEEEVASMDVPGSKGATADSIHLFDKDLSQFEVWMGVPHTKIEGLPEGTYQANNVRMGEPMGLNNDVKEVFSVIEEDGEVVVHVTGEIYGALSTLEEFADYHLSVDFKWGELKWPPREKAKRDSGILYHAYGPHGRFWEVWKTSLEYQVQETDLGDFIALGGNTAKPQRFGAPRTEIRGDGTMEPKRFDPKSELYFKGKGYIHAASEHDAPHGEWNTLEIYVLGNDAVHMVNGHVVMVVENARNHKEAPLVKGQIQIQSEAAECYYKNLVLTPITEFPESIQASVRFKETE